MRAVIKIVALLLFAVGCRTTEKSSNAFVKNGSGETSTSYINLTCDDKRPNAPANRFSLTKVSSDRFPDCNDGEFKLQIAGQTVAGLDKARCLKLTYRQRPLEIDPDQMEDFVEDCKIVKKDQEDKTLITCKYVKADNGHDSFVVKAGDLATTFEVARDCQLAYFGNQPRVVP